MSALTDLFTAMANKIRSKTGTATTYTPAQMVSTGIDDVYTAGYNAGGGGGGGGIPITPSNSSPASMSSGTTYEAQANGYAIASYSSITPSDSTPVALTSGSIYKAGGAGYAIASSPTSVTPTTSGASFSQGIVNMTAGGYAYSQRPSLVSTTLWTNNSPTSDFAAQNVNLSDSMANYDYIGIRWKRAKASSETTATVSTTIWPVTDMQNTDDNNDSKSLVFGLNRLSSGGRYCRYAYYKTNSQIYISAASLIGGSTTNATSVIPLNIYGYTT